MVIVNPVHPQPFTQVERKRKKDAAGEGADFSGFVSAGEETQSRQTVHNTGGTAPVANSLLFLQEVHEYDTTEQQALTQAEQTLGALENLRDALLGGSLSHAALKELESVVQQQRRQDLSPALQSVIDEIELRAAVELAKIERAGSR